MLKEIESYRYFLTNQKRQEKATIDAYLSDIKVFCDFYIGCLGHECQSWRDITVDDARQYRNHLVDLDKKVTTINHYMSSMRVFYDYLMIKGVAEFNPFREINLFLREREAPQVLNDKEAAKLIGAPMREYEAIIDSLAGQRKKAPGPLFFLRDQLILEIFYHAGLKISELMRLKDHDIDCHTKSIYIKNKHRPNKERVLPLPECVIRSFESYLANREKVWPYRSAPALFLNKNGKPMSERSIGRMIGPYLMKSGLDPRISPQTLRSTFALRAIKQGSSPETIMYILGYESLESKFGEKVISMNVIGEYERIEGLARQLEEEQAERLENFFFENSYSPGWWWLTIHDERACKAKAVKTIVEYAGFSFDDLVVFGDNLNDVNMFKEAKHSVAVANASEEIKSLATEVIGTNEEDSVVKYIAERTGRS